MKAFSYIMSGVLGVAVFLMLAWINPGEDSRVSAETYCEGRTSAVIRLNSGEPYIHENLAHIACNVTSVSASGKTISVVFDSPMSAVFVAEANADEQLALQGVACGVTGAVSGATIYCNKDIDEIVGTYANIWFSVEGIQ